MSAYPGNIDRSKKPGIVCVSRQISAAPEQVWKVIGTREGMLEWMRMHNFDPRLGGRVLIDTSGKTAEDRIIVYGRVQRVEPDREMCFSWRQFYEDGTGWPDFTELKLTLEPVDDGTRVELSHSGFEKLGKFRDRAYSVYHHCWVKTPYLERLYLECHLP